MKRTFAILCVLISTGLFPRPALAIYMTGKDLMRTCLSDAPQDVHECMGYVAGVIDYHMMLQSLGTAPTIDFCLPDDFPVSKATVAVLEYLRKAPINNDFIAAPTVAMALHESYPCAAAGRTHRKK